MYDSVNKNKVFRNNCNKLYNKSYKILLKKIYRKFK